ncbi:hypothetical protein [Clostridium sp. DMHC 10]|nr:hypothetical protein [Clostridium sp. DMHC 10]
MNNKSKEILEFYKITEELKKSLLYRILQKKELKSLSLNFRRE